MDDLNVGCGGSFIEAVNAFIFFADKPAPCDAIFIPGSALCEHVLMAAELYRQGYAPVIIPSGKYAIGSSGFAGDPAFSTEWEWMRHLLLSHGVPEEAILREDQATYTWENAVNSRRATDQAGLKIRKAMLCCMSYHARRALLYYQAAYPETEWIVCPAQHTGFTSEDWFLSSEGRDKILGEVRRLGSQVNDVFAMMLKNGGHGHEHP